MKKINLIAIICMSFLFTIPKIVFCGSTGVDALMEKLVEKGIINKTDVLKLKEDIIDDEKIAAEENIDKILPSWVKNTKLKGDLRLRFQKEQKETDSKSRMRERIRFRLGAETKVNDNTKVYFGLATGGTDPRSTNQTLENTFELKDIRLDYAYAEYIPSDLLKLTGGRMKNPIWEPGDLLWDTDINPEGLGLNLTLQINPMFDFYLNSGAFILDENKTDIDPWMFLFQPGLKCNINDYTKLNFTTSFYTFRDIKDKEVLIYTSGDNTTYTASSKKYYKYNYNSYNPAFELAFKNVFKGIPALAFSGEAIHNSSTSNNNNGYLGGIRLGYDKVNDLGQWQIKYMHKMLDKDAWLDVFPDSDTYAGKAGIRGNEYIFSYGLGKNISFDLDYYQMNLINDKTKTENLVQADLNFKF